jgi:hypothetical protein
LSVRCCVSFDRRQNDAERLALGALDRFGVNAS